MVRERKYLFLAEVGIYHHWISRIDLVRKKKLNDVNEQEGETKGSKKKKKEISVDVASRGFHSKKLA